MSLRSFLRETENNQAHAGYLRWEPGPLREGYRACQKDAQVLVEALSIAALALEGNGFIKEALSKWEKLTR